MTTVRRNVVANLVGRGWVTLVGFVFIPIYLRFLGIEAYGLVAFFATLQSVFGILDLGIGATINRELARLSAASDPPREQRTILRTLETLHWSISLAAGLLLFQLAPTIAQHWVQPEQLSVLTVERAVRVMGVILALQLPLSFYQAALMGLQRQITLNAIGVTAATARGVVTALVLWQVSASIEAFFVCQAAISMLQTVATFISVWSGLGGMFDARPEFRRVRSVWRFAAATSANAIVGMALTQLDRVVLSRLLVLEYFGYYALAGTLASFVWAIALPMNQALFPRFAQLFELRDEGTLTALYHRVSQAMVVAVVPAAATVALFSWHVMWLWTRNATTAEQTAVIAALLVAGTAINALVSVPGYLQAATGWPQLMVYTNMTAAVVLVPAILLVVPSYGATGAAGVWVVLNAAYMVFNVPLMHRRLLRGEQLRWFRDDIARPVIGAVVIVAMGRWLLLADEASRVLLAAWIAAVWAIASIVCAALAPLIRPAIFRRLARGEVSIGC